MTTDLMPIPRTHHLDRRATAIAAASVGGPDDLLTTRETAEWLGVSVQFLEIGRCGDSPRGPPFVRLSPRCVRYRRGDVLKWLAQRTHLRTGEYKA